MINKKSDKTSKTKPSGPEKKRKVPEWLFSNIAEASKNARKIYFIYIGFLFYCAITAVGTPDRDIILNKEVHLPLFNVDVPILGFLSMAPLVATFVFIYFQLYLGRLKWLINLSTNYAPIEKGRLYPWMLNFPKDPERGFTKGLQKIIIKFSLWGLLPLVLGLFALLSARTHDPFYSYIVGAMPILGVSFVLLFWFCYEGVQRKFIKFILKNWGKTILVFVLLLFELIHLLFIIPQSRKGHFFSLDLSYEKLITEPKPDYPGIYWGHFSEVHLEGALLISTILKRADLSKAHLQYTIMNEANLEGADLSLSNLRKATLRETNLRKADLGAANLREADLIKTNLREADLRGADLWRADLWRADLRGADLTGADLTGANLRGANLQRADLREAKGFSMIMLKKARNWPLAFYDEELIIKWGLPSDHNDRVSQRNFSEYNFFEANLEGADLSDANLQGADLRGANLQGADLRGANLQEAKFLTIEQLSQVKTIYKAKLDRELEEQIDEKYPHLLEGPKREEEKD